RLPFRHSRAVVPPTSRSNGVQTRPRRSSSVGGKTGWLLPLGRMPAELAKAYEPREVEERWAKEWIRLGLFVADPSAPAESFSIVIPPPNVTGELHLGHALNNTLQDVL